MNYDTLEMKNMKPINLEGEENKVSVLPTSSSFEFVDGSQHSPYIITSSTVDSD